LSCSLKFDILHKLDLNARISDQPTANLLLIKTGKMDAPFYGSRQANCGYDYNAVNVSSVNQN